MGEQQLSHSISLCHLGPAVLVTDENLQMEMGVSVVLEVT